MLHFPSQKGLLDQSTGSNMYVSLRAYKDRIVYIIAKHSALNENSSTRVLNRNCFPHSDRYQNLDRA